MMLMIVITMIKIQAFWSLLAALSQSAHIGLIPGDSVINHGPDVSQLGGHFPS